MRDLSRREILAAGAGLFALAACGNSASKNLAVGGVPISPHDPSVERRDAARRKPGAAVVKASVVAAPTTVKIGDRMVSTWAFGDRPGAGGIRAKVGDLVEATFVNKLPSPNTLHWHGIALRNDMDGVHDITQGPVASGREFTYRFTAADAGTFWFHPHVGLELDRGLYAPLIVEDPHDPVVADVDVTLMLDDWLDGFGRTPEQVLANLRLNGDQMGQMGGGDMSNMGNMPGMGNGGTTGSMNSGLTGDVAYPVHLINGRAPSERQTIDAKPGQRIRLRLINAGSDTPYRFAVAGHRMTVTHTDGFPVVPLEVDNVVLGMGERYDVIVVAQSGAFPMVAVPEGKADPAAEAVLRTSALATAPAVGTRPLELSGKTASYSELVATDIARLVPKNPDRRAQISLTGIPKEYKHGIDGVAYPDSAPIPVREGERLRLKIVNSTMMFHPVHLHGHTFQMFGSGTARKDTVNVLPMSSVEIDIEADNPGQWMLHCHNTYHFESGMATTLSYRA